MKTLQRLVCLLALVATFAIPALATDVTLSSFQIKDWNYGGSTLKLRLYSSDTWTDSLGYVRGSGIAGSQTGFYKEILCAVSGTIATCPSSVIPSTIDSIDRPQVRITGSLFTETNSFKQNLFQNWMIPAIPTTTTWADLVLYNRAQPRPLSDIYYTAPQVDAKLAGLGVAGKATDVIYGTARLSVPAVLSAAPIVVGDNDARMQPYNVKLNGLVGNGIADDRAALNTLVNTTIAGSTAVVDLSAGSYVIGSNVTIPSNVTLRFAAGAKLLISNGAVVTILGGLDAGFYKIFALPNESTGTGLVRFSAADFQTVSGRLNAIRPQWWGALGDNSNDDTLPLQRCINAAIGLPLSALGTPRWADKAVDLGSGVIYKVTAPLTVIGVVGFSMYGGGQENTIIRGYGGTFGSPIESVLDLDGCFEGTFQNFSVEGHSTANYKFMVYYRRDPTFTARGSSATKFLHVKAGGTWITAGWQIGGSGYVDPYQEDNTLFTGCSARGAWAIGSNYWQHGWYFGTNQLANNLNHTIIGLDAVNVKNAVTISQSNVQIYGGEVAGADVMFNFPLGGVQGYTKVDGIRAEQVRKFIDWLQVYPVFFAAEFSNVEIQINTLALDPVDGTPDWIKFGGSHLILRNIRVLNQGSISGTATGGTTTTLPVAGTPWAVNAYTGYALELLSGTGSGQKTYITTNTNNTLTFSPALAVAPDATTTFRAFLRPTIRGRATTINITNVGVMGATLDTAFVGEVGYPNNVQVENFAELDVDSNVVHNWAGPLRLSASAYIAQTLAWGVIGSYPDTSITRVGTGQVGISSFSAGAGRIQAFGAPPAPAVDTLAGAGPNTYTYYVVARDGLGNKSLPSPATTLAGKEALSGAVWARIYPPTLAGGLPAVSYDILKGDTAHSLATNVALGQFPFYDYGQPTAVYVTPTIDETGKLTVDNYVFQGITPGPTSHGNIFTSALAFPPTKPAQITSNQNNYNPGGAAQTASRYIRLITDASRNITGLTFTSPQTDGQTHIIVNIGLADLVIKHQDVNSAPANRFYCSTAADITLTPKQAAEVMYDSTNAYWLVYKRP